MKHSAVALLAALVVAAGIGSWARAQAPSREYIYLGGRVVAVENSVNLAPTAVSVAPFSGNAASQIFTYVFQDPNGATDLGVLNVLINNFLTGDHACYLAYSRPANELYLVNDAGNGLVPGSINPGGSGSLTNSQCTVNASGSSSTPNGNTLNLILNLSFTSSFGGNKVTYLAASDGGNLNSGWQALGVWNVPGATAFSPAVVSMSPTRDSGAGPTTFTFQFSDTDGWQDLGVLNILVNNSLNGANACYLAYVRDGNTLYLMNDAGDALLTGLVLNGTGSTSNSQCTISGASSSANGSGTTLTLTLNISFSGTFSGNRIFYLAARDVAEHNSGWQTMGTWLVP